MKTSFTLSAQQEQDIKRDIFYWWIDWVDTQELTLDQDKALRQLELLVHKIVLDTLEKKP